MRGEIVADDPGHSRNECPHSHQSPFRLPLPVTCQRDETQVLSSFWNVSTTSNSRSVTLSKNCFAHSLRLSFETTSTPPVVVT